MDDLLAQEAERRLNAAGDTIEIAEGGFYLRNDGTTLAVTKLLATVVKFAVLNSDECAVEEEQKLSLKQFRAAIVGVADVPLPEVGSLYREPREPHFDDFELDAVRVVSVTDATVVFKTIEAYGVESTYRNNAQTVPLVRFITTYSERVYEPRRMPQIVEGGVYRDHDGSLFEVVRIESPGAVESGKRARTAPDPRELLAVFRVNGGDYEYREVPRFLSTAVAATLDRSALTSDAIAEADYKGQVTTALARFNRAEAHMAEASEQKKSVEKLVAAAAEERKIALAGLTQIGNGQAQLPGIHA